MDKQKYLPPIHRLFTENFAVKKNEHVLVFTDKPSHEVGTNGRSPLHYKIVKLIAEEGEKFAQITFHSYPETCSHGAEPPLSLWKLAFGKEIIDKFKKQNILKPLLNKTATEEQIKLSHRIVGAYCNTPLRKINAVIALSWYSTTHTRFRKLLTESYKVRYASMPLFEPEMLLCPMGVDVKKLEKRTMFITRYLTDADKVIITANNGTNLTFSIKGRSGTADTGVLKKEGSVSNLPAGEAYIAPLEGTAKGRLIANYAPSRKLREPLIFYIEKGRIVKLEGDKEKKDQLTKVFQRFPKARVLAEFGIGTNEKAKNPSNILESEKILGTIHIAFGDNSTFGGKNNVPFHEDFVVFRPTVRLISLDKKEKIIINNGKLICLQ